MRQSRPVNNSGLISFGSYDFICFGLIIQYAAPFDTMCHKIKNQILKIKNKPRPYLNKRISILSCFC